MMIDNSTASLQPFFRQKVEIFFKKIREAGITNAYIFEGRRSQARQYELFGKGRSAAVLKRYGVPSFYADPSAKIVTWTLQSKHLEGKAIDVVFDMSKDPKVRRPSWNGNYAKLIEIAKSMGIRNLSPLETCHFEI